LSCITVIFRGYNIEEIEGIHKATEVFSRGGKIADKKMGYSLESANH
jgi:hypothetical protein